MLSWGNKKYGSIVEIFCSNLQSLSHFLLLLSKPCVLVKLVIGEGRLAKCQTEILTHKFQSQDLLGLSTFTRYSRYCLQFWDLTEKLLLSSKTLLMQGLKSTAVSQTWSDLGVTGKSRFLWPLKNVWNVEVQHPTFLKAGKSEINHHHRKLDLLWIYIHVNYHKLSGKISFGNRNRNFYIQENSQLTDITFITDLL